MGQARILTIRTESRIRPWHWLVGVFGAVAAGVVVYNALAPDAPESEGRANVIAQPAATTQSRATIWGQPTEMGADGKQKSTNNMWGLMLRASNEADDARNQRDIAYAQQFEKISDGCRYFWRSRLVYNDFMEATNLEEKMSRLHNINFKDNFFPAVEKGSVYGYGQVYQQMGPQALDELRKVIESHPGDLMGNFIREFDYVHIASSLNKPSPYTYIDIDKRNNFPIMMAAYKKMQTLLEREDDPNSFKYLDVRVFVEAGTHFYFGLVNPEIKEKFLQETQLTEGGAKDLYKKFTRKRHAMYDRFSEDYNRRALDYARDMGAPCPSPGGK